jgi:hypothetical protein
VGWGGLQISVPKCKRRTVGWIAQQLSPRYTPRNFTNTLSDILPVTSPRPYQIYSLWLHQDLIRYTPYDFTKTLSDILPMTSSRPYQIYSLWLHQDLIRYTPCDFIKTLSVAEMLSINSKQCISVYYFFAFSPWNLHIPEPKQDLLSFKYLLRCTWFSLLYAVGPMDKKQEKESKPNPSRWAGSCSSILPWQ